MKVYEVLKGPSHQCIIFKYWTLTRLLTFLNYTYSLICNFEDVVSHPHFSLLYFWCVFLGFMIILVKINADGFL